MTTSLKDVSAAQMVNALSEMGCFERDCTIYGYAFERSDGKHIFRMSEDEVLIHQAFEEQFEAGSCLTPVCVYPAKAALREETEEETLLYFKLQLANQMKEEFNDVYYQAIRQLESSPRDNQAAELLFAWQDELIGYYDEDALHLFEGAVKIAYSNKHLTDETFRKFGQWVKQIKKQFEHRLQLHDEFSRTFYGVAYWERGEEIVKYISNADEKAFYNKVKSLDEQGYMHTPIYQKTYWYHRSNELATVRKQYDADLRNAIDQTYLTRMKTIFAYESAIPTELWNTCLEEVKANCSEAAIGGLQYWGNRWGISCK